MIYQRMMFPETWEEFEEQYGFTDRFEMYSNGERLIPSFRVKQWLCHLEEKRHAKWKLDGSVYKCSNCGNAEPYYDFSYCPCCGARMDG